MGLFGFGNKEQKSSLLRWEPIVAMSDLDKIVELSHHTSVLIFKHSTRCSISSMALNRLEREWEETNVIPYYLDLLNYREISNEIAFRFGVTHQSPQVLLLEEGKCVFDASHSAISFEQLK